MKNASIIGKEVPILSTNAVALENGQPTSASVYHVLSGPSIFYFGPRYELPLRNLSGNNEHNIKYTIPPSFGFTNLSSHPTNFMDYSYHPTIIKGNMFLRTANNLYWFDAKELELGPIYHHEDIREKFLKWKDACEGDKTVEYVKLPPEIGLLEGPEELAYFDESMTQLRKFVKEVVYSGPYNKLGVYLSKKANFEQDLRDALFDERHYLNKDTEQWINFLASKGHEYSKGVESIGVKKMKAIAAYHPIKHYLVTSTDIDEKAAKIAMAHGLGSDAIKHIKRYVIYHEFYHVMQEQHRSERMEEIEVGQLLEEFFAQKATLSEGSKKSSIYRALANEGKAYKIFWEAGGPRSIKKILSKNSKNLKDLEYALRAEATILNGLEDEQAIKEYITNGIEEHLQNLESEEKEKSNLEKIVDSKETSEEKSLENELSDEKSTYESAERDEAALEESSEAAECAETADGE